MSLYAQIILPVPLDRSFSYEVPESMAADLAVGSRVLVPFGPKLYYTGIVESFTPHAPQGEYRIKPITALIDRKPVIRHPQLNFWRWIADYYLSAIGDVFKCALPSGLKVESETNVEINPDIKDEPDAMAEVISTLDDDSVRLLTLLNERGRMSSKELARTAGLDCPERLVSRLLDSGAVVVSEKLVERFRRKRISYVRLAADLNVTPDKTNGMFAAVKGAKKQEQTLLTLISLSERGRKEVSLKDLTERADVGRPIVKALADKGLVEIFDREVSRFAPVNSTPGELPVLSDPQSTALDRIHKSFLERDVCLLHGVTSSGKTEIYIHLIDYVLRRGDQALYLVPEIALTTQLTARLQKVFGDRVVIYHSKFSDAERVEIWQRLLNSSEPCVVVGARSAVFLPFAKLGIVIVDEEHESSYKQYDPAPRYNGRDAAIVLASMHGAKTLLGSATPSVETYYKAVEGKFGLVSLTERYESTPLPEIEIADLKRERRAGRVVGSFADTTVEQASEEIAGGSQVIFFHNRRGYAPMARCKQCAFVPKCDHCDVSLTYHRSPEALVCHYCGAVYPVMRTCPQCHEPAIEIVGFGTERIEDEVATRFPDRRILRMDLDTTRNKDSYQRIIGDFSAHKADILVGTQMVTKGLDFGDVSLVGVISADALIHYPDFRSAERAFNMLEQVSGRAGRRDCQGKVIIQTYQPDNPVIDFVSRHDYLGFYAHELEERRAFAYPPFSRVINIYIKHRNREDVERFALDYANRLKALFGSRVNGPREPHVQRVQSLYIRSIMLKIETAASMRRVKEILRQLYIDTVSSPTVRGFSIYYDVDPV